MNNIQKLEPLWQNVPEELRQYKNFVLWRYVKRKNSDKLAKPPFSADGSRAKPNDASTWTTFQKAVSAYVAGGFEGIGFALSDSTPFVGVDLDNCYCPAFQLVAPHAQDVINSLQSYSEITPSGRGIRVLVSGKEALPVNGLNRKLPELSPENCTPFGLELYKADRYLTLTGRQLDGSPDTIEHRPEALALIFRQYSKDQQNAAAADMPLPEKSVPGANTKAKKHFIRREVRIFPHMFASEAFQQVAKAKSGLPLAMLCRIMQKRKWNYGKRGVPSYTSDKFYFPYEEVKALFGVKADLSITRAFKLLQRLGFIDVVVKGGQFKDGRKQVSQYVHSERWRTYSEANADKALTSEAVFTYDKTRRAKQDTNTHSVFTYGKTVFS